MPKGSGSSLRGRCNGPPQGLVCPPPGLESPGPSLPDAFELPAEEAVSVGPGLNISPRAGRLKAALKLQSDAAFGRSALPSCLAGSPGEKIWHGPSSPQWGEVDRKVFWLCGRVRGFWNPRMTKAGPPHPIPLPTGERGQQAAAPTITPLLIPALSTSHKIGSPHPLRGAVARRRAGGMGCGARGLGSQPSTRAASGLPPGSQ
jgi:hypothetical protein